MDINWLFVIFIYVSDDNIHAFEKRGKKMKMKIQTIALGILSVGLLFALPILSGTGAGENTGTAGVEWNGIVCPTVIKADGNIETMDCSHNTITTEGKNHIRKALGNNELGATAFKYLAVGNGTAAAAGDTSLNSEITDCGLARAAGTYTADAVAGNWSQQYQWTSTCDNIIVNTTGLFNASTAGATDTILADADFSASVTLQTGDKLNVTYITWVT